MSGIGIFGGTFNPIHIGHLRTALEVREGLGLSRVILIPSAIPPHKAPHGVADAEARLEMTRLAAAEASGLEVSDVELRRAGPSYTIDTIRHFKSDSPDAPICFIVGMDAFLEIDTWRSWQTLLDEVPFVVMDRPGENGSGSPPLEDFLRRRIDPGYWFDGWDEGEGVRIARFHHPRKQPIRRVAVTRIEISSTAVRQRIRNGRTIRFLVPRSVEDYIQTRGLFK
jgi:nicotinate-nucleotide adenylyltransferase